MAHMKGNMVLTKGNMAHNTRVHYVSVSALYYFVCHFLQNPGKAGHEIQSSTLELINGLVSLVHQPALADVAQGAMEVMLV